ncbi:MAG: aspartate racemase, partial [Clostridiales bacterium]|nr:aspartate racemase [Clostridiales bacterium]
IYENVKAGRPADMDAFFRVSEELREAGAEVIILGCTELSVVREKYPIGAGYLDAMQVMAKCAVDACEKLKASCRELITSDAVTEG